VYKYRAYLGNRLTRKHHVIKGYHYQVHANTLDELWRKIDAVILSKGAVDGYTPRLITGVRQGTRAKDLHAVKPRPVRVGYWAEGAYGLFIQKLR